jgi:hypothetical protein
MIGGSGADLWTCYGLQCEGRMAGGLGADLWRLGLRASVPAVLQYPRVLFTLRVVAAATVGGT